MRRSFDDHTLRGSLRPRGPIQLGLSTRHEGDLTVVTVTGEVDVLTAPKLSICVDEVIRRYRGDVAIDLSEAGFIDSLGLRALLGAQRRLERQRRSLVVVCGRGPVRRAIELARLDQALGLVASLAGRELRRSNSAG